MGANPSSYSSNPKPNTKDAEGPRIIGANVKAEGPSMAVRTPAGSGVKLIPGGSDGNFSTGRLTEGPSMAVGVASMSAGSSCAGLQKKLDEVRGPCPDNLPYLGTYGKKLFCYDLARSKVCSYKKGDVAPSKGYTWGDDQPACYP